MKILGTILLLLFAFVAAYEPPKSDLSKLSPAIGAAKMMRPKTRTPEPHPVDTIGYDSNHKAIIYRNNQVETVTIEKYHTPTLHH